MSDYQAPDSGAADGAPLTPEAQAGAPAPTPVESQAQAQYVGYQYPQAPTAPPAFPAYPTDSPYQGQPGQPGQPGSNYYQGYPAGYPYMPGYGNQTSTNGMSIAALVCGLCGFIYGVPAILGIIFGFVSLSQIKQRGQSGRGMALAGIIVGALWLVLFIILIIAVIAIVHSQNNINNSYTYGN